MPSKFPYKRRRPADATASLGQLLEDVADGIRVLQTRDGLAVSEDQIRERARNIVAGLLGNYKIETLDRGDVVGETISFSDLPPR